MPCSQKGEIYIDMFALKEKTDKQKSQRIAVGFYIMKDMRFQNLVQALILFSLNWKRLFFLAALFLEIIP